MRILISGICGFVGSTLALRLREMLEKVEIFGFDNFLRPGSELNRLALRQAGIAVRHSDLRSASDIDALPRADWVIDAAANPSVLAGVDDKTSSRQVVEHNLGGTINLLEYCKNRRAGFILLSTSRVYSITALSQMKVVVNGNAFRPDLGGLTIRGLSGAGVSEDFSNEPPLSLYGCTKLASECLALEYGEAFDFPVWINRCGVLAGAGQFGRFDQGIFAFWINSWLRHQPLKYLGFEGRGYQVRDCLHPRDLVTLLQKQMSTRSAAYWIINVGGGVANSMSLAQLSDWCSERFGPREVIADPKPRQFDIPWMVLDSRRASSEWGWGAETPIENVLEEIATHAKNHPDWLELSAP
jgi:CDP-paratose 2-epimerase